MCAQRSRVHTWSRRQESNPQPTAYKAVALPIELRRHPLRRLAQALFSGKSGSLSLFVTVPSFPASWRACGSSCPFQSIGLSTRRGSGPARRKESGPASEQVPRGARRAHRDTRRLFQTLTAKALAEPAALPLVRGPGLSRSSTIAKPAVQAVDTLRLAVGAGSTP